MEPLFRPELTRRNTSLIPRPGSLPRPTTAGPGDVAVVLNRNARGVTARRLGRLRALHPEGDLFLSESAEHSRRIAEEILGRGYRTVLLGGGDGTFVRCLNDLWAASQHLGLPLPRLGVLPLGTGNALGHFLGLSSPSPRGLLTELARARDPRSLERPLSLLRVDGLLTPFAGTGLDSQILEDYRRTSKTLDAIKIGALLASTVRYALAVALCSVPRFVLRKLPQVEVVNVGGPAYAVLPDGQPDPTPLPRGTVLYRGPCTLAGAATIPCFGFGVRIFPFAHLVADKFQVRCTDASALEALTHLPSVLRGDYRSPSLRDFYCDAVEIHVERPVPMQIGGDVLEERRDFMRIEMAEHPVRILAAT
ncbi:MAG: diacylglycerol kinase family protein [Polyangia bacterium]